MYDNYNINFMINCNYNSKEDLQDKLISSVVKSDILHSEETFISDLSETNAPDFFDIHKAKEKFIYSNFTEIDISNYIKFSDYVDVKLNVLQDFIEELKGQSLPYVRTGIFEQPKIRDYCLEENNLYYVWVDILYKSRVGKPDDSFKEDFVLSINSILSKCFVKYTIFNKDTPELSKNTKSINIGTKYEIISTRTIKPLKQYYSYCNLFKRFYITDKHLKITEINESDSFGFIL